MKNKTLAILAIFLLSSCALLQQKKPDPEISFLSQAPRVNIQEFFDGDIDVFAIMQDENGKIIKSYTASIYGEWDENKGVVKNKYFYNDGSKDSRTWLITDNKNDTFDAVGHDMAEAARGQQKGNAIQMLYALYVKENGIKTKVRFEESYYLVDKDSMIANAIAKDERGKIISKATISLKKIRKNKDSEARQKSESKVLSLKKPEQLENQN